ncbi:MAG: transcriptional regulator NrdR [Nanoarchaeota archaeon]|nr:transcriptional regulator NrdR [Nanoarchaeota archaeon]
MKCPYCKHEDTKVTDSRDNPDEAIVRRRRECPKCQKRFTTYERVETANILVIKKDQKREQFDREKLKKGLLKACEKRPIPLEKIDAAVSEIEFKIANSGETEVSSKKIGELVMSSLKKLDKVAYIRFASVYREFADIETFQGELNKLMKK